MRPFDKLVEPGRIGGLELKNRMVMAPMVTRFAGNRGEVTQRMVDYYVERARGGVGLIVTEATYFNAEGTPGRLSIYEKDFMSGLKFLADEIHASGSKVAMELNPGRGRKDVDRPICASVVPKSRFVPEPVAGKTLAILSIEEIDVLIREFGEAASRVRDIGFDALMVHGAASYLVMDFLSPLTNMRTDEYGGSTKARARLAVRLVECARRNIGEEYPIIFRITAEQHVEGGFSVEESGCNAIDVISGSQAAPEWSIPPMGFRSGCNADLAAGVRSALKIPVMVAGRINDPFLAEEILEDKKADFVDLGRALVADAEFPRKVEAGRVDGIRRCLGCNICYQRVVVEGSELKCTVNAEVGRESEFKVVPTRGPKKVLVIGGGPAGMESARVAASRGHVVTLWEKSQNLGGQVSLAAVPPRKREMIDLVKYLSVQIKKAGVTVELDREATLKSVTNFAPDVVIVATGAKPLIPEISGLREQEERVILALDVLAGSKHAGSKVVIIGGELVGCETGEYLASSGKKVVITSLLSGMATTLPSINRSLLLRSLVEKGVSLLPAVTYESVENYGVEILDSEGKRRSLEADTIVIAAGFIPNDDLFKSLGGVVEERYAIGDCVRPRNILEAIGEAAEIARRI
jgi:2,4-dienoyl-CoA reductase-like NADH-dependent reductase (Old Yellow Enzyme family)/thioredoxin reductase